jgi:hypothetical protein
MADNVNAVEKMYVEYFGRPADPNGLNFWVKALNNDPNVLTQIAQDFSTSAEYQSMYGGLSNRDVVLAVYQNMFGRVGEQTGVDFWTKALDNHTISINNVVSEIVKGAQGNDLLVFNGRVAVATAFTDHIDTQAEIAAYAGPKANQIASDFIDSIIDLQTAASARDPGVIDTKIAEIVGSHTTGIDGSHFVA